MSDFPIQKESKSKRPAVLGNPPRIWLIGAYFQSGRSGRMSAFYEVTFGLIMGTLPFWVGGLVFMALGRGDVEDPSGFWLHQYWILTKSTFSKGELLIFAVSFLSPALWLASHEPEGAATLPHRRPIAVLTLIVCVVGTMLFALTQAGVVLDTRAIYGISLGLTLCSVIVMYLALTYHGFRLPPPDLSERDFRRGQENFMNAYDSHRKGA